VLARRLRARLANRPLRLAQLYARSIIAFRGLNRARCFDDVYPGLRFRLPWCTWIIPSGTGKLGGGHCFHPPRMYHDALDCSISIVLPISRPRRRCMS
jgi:hypothetical protein